MSPPRKTDPQLHRAAYGKPTSMASWSSEARDHIHAQYQAWKRISASMAKNAENLTASTSTFYNQEELLQLAVMLENMKQLSLWIGGEMGQKIEMLHTISKLAYELHLAHFAKVHASQS